MILQSDEVEAEPLITLYTAASTPAGLKASRSRAKPRRWLATFMAERPVIGIQATSMPRVVAGAVGFFSIDDPARPSLPLDEGGDRDRRIDAIE